jgi:CelD/BcsL family acetyltransferase involved in cellulose biosynthesis
MGFDPAVSTAGAGSVLMKLWIADCIERGDRLIDLGPDYAECKRHWLTREAVAYRYTHFAPGVRTGLLRLARRLSASA